MRRIWVRYTLGVIGIWLISVVGITVQPVKAAEPLCQQPSKTSDSPPSESTPPQPLPGVGTEVKREIKTGETHAYRVHLEAGQYLYLAIEQHGVDVSVTFHDPSGKAGIETNNFINDFRLAAWSGTEVIHKIASEPGEYRVLVRPKATDTEGAPFYILETLALRSPTAIDIAQVQGYEALTQTGVVWVQGGPMRLQNTVRQWELVRAFGYQAQNKQLELKGAIECAFAQIQLGKPWKSVELFEESLHLCQSYGDLVQQGIFFSYLGQAYISIEQTEKGILAYQQALAIWQQLGLIREQGALLNALVVTYLDKSQLQLAFEYLARYLEHCRKHGHSAEVALGLANMGVVFSQLGDHARAVDLFNQAFQIWKEGKGEPSPAWVSARRALGENYLQLNKYTEAQTCCQEALEQAILNQYQPSESFARQCLGQIFQRQKQWSKAQDQYQKSLAILEQRRSIAQSQPLFLLGNLSYDQGKYDKAFGFYTRALAIDRADLRSLGSSDLLQIARTELKRNHLNAALAAIEEAAAVTELLRKTKPGQDFRALFQSTVHETYEVWIDILTALHRAHPKEGYQIKAFEISERSRMRSFLDLAAESKKQSTQGPLRSMVEREQALRKRLAEQSEKLLRLSEGEKTEADELKQNIEALRIQLANVQAEMNPAEKIHSGLVVLASLQARLKNTDPANTRLTASLNLEIERTTRDLNSLKAEYQSENQKRDEEPHILPLAQIQASLLEPDLQVCAYLLGEEQSYAWIVTQTSLDTYVLPKRELIEKAVDRYRQLMSGEVPSPTQPQAIAQAGQAVSKLLLEPVRHKFTGKRLLIIPDGVLYTLPFAALPIGKGPKPDEPLLVSQEVVQLPSISMLAFLRAHVEKRSPGTKSIAVFANPVFSETDPRVASAQTSINTQRPTPSPQPQTLQDEQLLAAYGTISAIPFTQKQADAIQALVPDALIADGFKASKQTLQNPDLKEYRILHFATHGRFDSDHPELSGLILSLVDEHGTPQDGYVLSPEIFSLRLDHCDLVVLSVCDSSLGKRLGGEGVAGLVQSFMYVGVPRVISSLWKVGEKSATRLMERFYWYHLKEGKSPAQALRLAQLEMWQDPAWRGRREWAAFQLQGEWR